MRKSLALLAALAFAGSAWASSCPKEMKAIDAALPNAKLSAMQMQEVKKLRADGEAAHKAGRHAESMEHLGKAKKHAGHLSPLATASENAARGRRFRLAWKLVRRAGGPPYGTRITEPVVLRPSRSRWHCAASASL
jgi:hypothetical protein